MKEISARKKTPTRHMVWFDGTNALEVALFMQSHGKGGAEVKFDGRGGTSLYLFGNGVQLPTAARGIWIDTTFEKHTQTDIDTQYEVLEQR